MIKSESFYIEKDKYKNKYTVFFDKSNKLLIESIGIIIKNIIISEDYSSFYYYAHSVKTFSEYVNNLFEKIQINRHYMPQETLIKLSHNIITQLKFLLSKGYGFFSYNINDIIIIDNMFISLSSDLLYPIINDTYHIGIPFDKSRLLLSPELQQITEIPCSVHFKSTYYSVGLLLMYCYTINKINNENMVINSKHDTNNIKLYNLLLNTEKDINALLKSTIIYNTKIGKLIERCLENDFTKRNIIYI